MTYFTADQHFGHFNIIRLSHRPFASLDEMNEAMIAKWNAKVKPGDAVFMRRSRMFNAGVDVNGFEPVSFEELVSNNAAFRRIHADTARSNPLTMFCAEV